MSAPTKVLEISHPPVAESLRSGGGLIPVLVLSVPLFAVAAAAWWAGEEELAILFTTGAACLLLLLIGLMSARWPGRAGRLRLAVDEDGVTVVGSPWPSRLEALAVVPAVIGTGWFLVRLGWPGDVLGALTLVLLVGLLALTARSALRIANGTRRVPAITLTRSGVSVTQPDGREPFAWSDLVGMSLEGKGGRLLLRGHEGSSVPILTQELRSDPALVAALVRTYLATPSRRPELADERVLDRLRAGRLDHG